MYAWPAEYNHLMTSQLESQMHYFEGLLSQKVRRGHNASTSHLCIGQHTPTCAWHENASGRALKEGGPVKRPVKLHPSALGSAGVKRTVHARPTEAAPHAAQLHALCTRAAARQADPKPQAMIQGCYESVDIYVHIYVSLSLENPKIRITPQPIKTHAPMRLCL